MLVLSRRPSEKIVFPGLNVSVQVVAVRPGLVRLGIDAPPEISVYREEIVDQIRARPPGGPRAPDGAAPGPPGKVSHAVRNRLNVGTFGLALLRGQLKGALTPEAETTLGKVNQELQDLWQQVQGLTEPAAAPPPRPCKALLVEDDRNECELMAGFLRLAGYDVATAGDGADALNYLQAQGRPDVMLLDMVLPRCDGATTVRAIRQDPAYAGLKIFAVSGYPQEQFGLDQGSRGVDRWFRKPLNPETLLRELNQEIGPRP